MEKENQKLQVSIKTIDKYKKLLITHYEQMDKYKDKAKYMAEKVIQCALNGTNLEGDRWNRAPKSFDNRIERLSKLGAHSVRGPSKGKVAASEKKIWKETKELKENRRYQGQIATPLLDSLDNKQRKFFLEREKYYYEEFEFNQSSDYVTLMGLIADELLYQKLYQDQLQTPNDKISKQLSESHARIVKAQEILGITRKQRESLNKKVEGSVSDLSLDLNRKLKEREKRKGIEKRQNEYFEAQKADRNEEFKGIKVGNRISNADLKKLIG